MSVTILEALQNAEINLGNGTIGLMIAKDQLHSAVTLLDKGYHIDEEVEPLLKKYGNADVAPEVPHE